MTKQANKIIGVLIVLTTLLCGVGCGFEKAKSDAFVFARGEDSVGLDPARQTDGESFSVCGNIYDTLVRFKQESTEIEPSLAVSWDISPDELVYTFRLREGVRFHDGTEFNADAVCFSLLRQMEKNHPFHKYGPYKYWLGMGMQDIVDKIEKIDDFSVRITLKQPEAPFLANLAMDFASVVSPAAVEKYKEDFDFHPVGTGPFIFERWEPRERIILRKNPDYWDGAPSVERVIFRAIPEPETRALEFRAGAVDAMEFPNPYDLEDLSKDPNTNILTQPGLNICYLAMNTDKPPFDILEVRLAMNHAINKKTIVEHLYQGMGIPAKNPLPPTIWGYNDEIEEFEYNPQLARELLKKAGFPNGFETTLWVMNNPRPYILLPLKVAEAILNDLAQVGIKARLVTYDWGTYLAKLDNGEHDMAIMGWSGDNGDPDNFLYVLLGSQAAVPPATNVAFYRSDEFQEILHSAKRTADFEKRVSLYKKAQEVFRRDAPWVPLAHTTQTIVAKKYVKGLVLHPTTRKDFRWVTMER